MKRKGSILLIVLIAIAIVMMLYAIQMMTIFGPNLPTHRVGAEQRPWLLEEMLVTEGESIKLPRKPKPTLNEPITLTANVIRNNADRGTATINLGTDGRIQVTWNSDYAYNEKTHFITTEMTGNINVKQTYENENGKDKSRLFFIARGDYSKQTTTAETGTVEEKGTAYMLGWLQPDHTADGHITITTDRKWAVAYEFTTQGLEN